jgi:tetratricopeptide (TPR) repeat protein
MREAYTLQQDQATSDLGIAMLMLVLGRAEQSLSLARATCEAPDRGGNTSDDGKVLALSAALGYAAALQSRLEQAREKNDRVTIATLELDANLLTRRTRKSTDTRLLIATLRPYLAGGPDVGSGVPSWLRSMVLRFFPPGVAAEAIRQARIEETHELAVPYLDAIDAEIHLTLGDRITAVNLAQRALAGLSREGEKLLTARVALVAADASFALGDVSTALPLYERVLQDFPAAFRLHGTALPVQIQNADQTTSSMLAKALRSSPRLRDVDRGFRLEVSLIDETLNYRLLRHDGTQILDERVIVDAKADSVIASAVAAIHERLLSPTVDLTQRDIDSLDGSPIAARTRESIDRLLEPIRPK